MENILYTVKTIPEGSPWIKGQNRTALIKNIMTV